MAAKPLAILAYVDWSDPASLSTFETVQIVSTCACELIGGHIYLQIDLRSQSVHLLMGVDKRHLHLLLQPTQQWRRAPVGVSITAAGLSVTVAAAFIGMSRCVVTAAVARRAAPGTCRPNM